LVISLRRLPQGEQDGTNQKRKAAILGLEILPGLASVESTAYFKRREKLVAQDLGETDGVPICDGSGSPKKGDCSDGRC
jgi:hypothetical protein